MAVNHAPGASGTRGPHLRRHKLDNFRSAAQGGILANPLCQSSIETKVVHPDKHIRGSFDRQPGQRVSKSPKFEVLSKGRDPNDGVLSEVKREFNARLGHFWTAGAKELKRAIARSPAKGLHQLGGQLISAGFTRDDLNCPMRKV